MLFPQESICDVLFRATSPDSTPTIWMLPSAVKDAAAGSCGGGNANAAESTQQSATANASTAGCSAGKKRDEPSANKNNGKNNKEDPPMPPSRPLKKARTSGGGRTFTKEELFFLAKAWMKRSTDAAVGTDQSQDSFWQGVLSDYNDLLAANTQRHGYVFPQRTLGSLKNIWYSSMLPAINKFTSICKNNPPISGQQNTDDYYRGVVDLYEIQVRIYDDSKEHNTKLPKSFNRFLPAYRWLITQPKWSGHLTTGRDGKVSAHPRPPQGRDATKLGRKVDGAASKIKTTMAKKMEEAQKTSDAFRADLCASLKKLNDFMVMSLAPEEKKNAYFQALSDATVLDAENAKKKAQLEARKLAAEAGEDEEGDGPAEADNNEDVVEVEVDAAEVQGDGQDNPSVVEAGEAAGIDNAIDLDGDSSHSSSWGNEYSYPEIRLKSASLIQALKAADMTGPWAGPVFKFIDPVDGKDDELADILSTLPGDILGAIILTNFADVATVNAIVKSVGCDCCSIHVMSPKDAIEKYTICNPPAGSQTEMLVQKVKVDNLLVFNYLADKFGEVDYPKDDDGEDYPKDDDGEGDMC